MPKSDIILTSVCKVWSSVAMVFICFEDFAGSLNLEIAKFFFPYVHCHENINIVRAHSEALATKGDFSFPIDRRIWCRQLNLPTDDSNAFANILSVRFTTIEETETIKTLIERSQRWTIPLKDASVVQNRCHLFLDRTKAIKFAMESILGANQVSEKPDRDKICFESTIDESANDLNLYRAAITKTVLFKVAPHCFDVNEELVEGCVRIRILSVTQSNKSPLESTREAKLVLCGLVTDNNGKTASMNLEEYVRLRTKDMQLMAMHKYGIRVKDESRFRNLISKLGEAAVKVDLLEAKHSSPVTVKLNGTGCTKGASFILYNSARLETLLRTFNEKVESGVYPEIPLLNGIDVDLLSEQDEWILVRNYLLAFPNVIKRSIGNLHQGKPAPHLLIQFLSGLVGVFSVYYKRIRILLENRNHLVPTVHARIYLVKCVREVLNYTLGLLDIQPVQYM